MTMTLQWLAITAIYFEYGQAFRSGLVGDLKDAYCTPTPLIFDDRNSEITATSSDILPTVSRISISNDTWLDVSSCLDGTDDEYLLDALYTVNPHSTSRERPLYVGRTDAEGIIIAIMAGMFLPTFAMIVSAQPIFTWLWQIFPVLVWGIQRGYVRIALRPCSAKNQQMGNTFIHDFLVFVFLMCWLLHATVVYPIIMGVDALKAIVRSEPSANRVNGKKNC
ncbi:hypothetical protein BDN71DRAFT_1451822 [Pleurotus eryngii]|uniref:Uncharacterized protein n=1 Tax=Pleurotus eryngii TaxID=5323 RepID=A0A9P6DDQ3_PLEER|nr:hypothetical protein BDN71DRAFT_1451822 [Pleurotus eryngii]